MKKVKTIRKKMNKCSKQSIFQIVIALNKQLNISIKAITFRITNKLTKIFSKLTKIIFSFNKNQSKIQIIFKYLIILILFTIIKSKRCQIFKTFKTSMINYFQTANSKTNPLISVSKFHSTLKKLKNLMTQ